MRQVQYCLGNPALRCDTEQGEQGLIFFQGEDLYSEPSKLSRSPSTVSEAPQAEERDLSRWAGALRIQRLEGSRPAIRHGLWVLYVGEQVLRVGETTVGGCVP